MATSVAARSSSRPLEINQPGDYPIVLGESLKTKTSSTSHYSRLRYNWQPKDGLDGSRGSLKRNGDNLSLAYKDGDARYNYSGSVNGDKTDHKTTDSQLVLIFDETRAAFVLERISKSFDLNLVSASGYSQDDIKKFIPIQGKEDGPEAPIVNRTTNSSSQDEDEPDASNPFDFRHFLAEAKDNAEKSSQTAGSRTPLPGGLTPVSGMASPAPGASRFLSSTPRTGPVKTIQKKKVDEHSFMKKNTNAATAKKAAQQKNEAQKPTLPVSKENISLSDDEASDEPLAEKPPAKGHKRNVSSGGFGRSPHIVVHDGGLEIDLGSPPPENRRLGRINPEAFRSRTGTPTMGSSGHRSQAAATIATAPSHDVEMPDRSDDEDNDSDTGGRPRHLVEDGHDNDHDNAAHEDVEDEDVEEFELGSPHDEPRHHHHHDSHQPKKPSRHRKPSAVRHRSPSPPPSPPAAVPDDDWPIEDEDEFAKELQIALEEEDDDDHDKVGLGIVTAAADEDESEISEEE